MAKQDDDDDENSGEIRAILECNKLVLTHDNDDDSSFSKALGLKPHHQIGFNVISKTIVGGDLTLYRDAINVFYSPSRLSSFRTGES